MTRTRLLNSVLLVLAAVPLAAPVDSAAQQAFRDVTTQAGIHFTHNNGAFGKKWLPETMGPGCAFIDYDNDGYPDVLLINGTDFAGHTHAGATTLKLYHNNHDGTFTDVTHKAGLAVPMFGLGVAVGDYDNDGFDDIFITALGQSRLFHNNGNGTFTDVTQKAGLAGPHEFSTAAAWVDYDKDGHLDLVVANYVQWSPETDLYCTLDGKSKSYCTPESYKGTSVRLWHNRGNGTFEEATQKAGLGEPTSKTLGVAVLDFDNNGWPDLLFSNDTQPNKLYRNNGKGLFVDEAPRSEIGRASLLTLGFGCFFFDYDLDGWPDVLVANGHIDADIQRVQANVKYAMPPHLFRNIGKGKFEEVTKSLGQSFATPRVGRGAAYADFKDDSRLGLLLSTNGGPVHLFRNEAQAFAASNKSLRIKLTGTRSNRDGIGTTVRLTSGGETQTQMLRSGSSYLSASELILTFGLAHNDKADTVEIRWPSGQIDRLSGANAGQTVTVTEGKGITASRAFGKKN